jgi:hypothetical protein
MKVRTGSLALKPSSSRKFLMDYAQAPLGFRDLSLAIFSIVKSLSFSEA